MEPDSNLVGHPGDYSTHYPVDPTGNYSISQTTSQSSLYPTELNGTPSPSDSQYIPPGYQSSPFYFSRLLLIRWEDENTHCYQVEENGVCVARRRDNDMVNGTKLLNVAKMTRGKRDAILKNESVRVVVKSGSMILKGVWIPYERAKQMAKEHKVFDSLYPLFEDDIYEIYASTLQNRRSSFVFGSNRWLAASSQHDSLLPHEALALRSMNPATIYQSPTTTTTTSSSLTEPRNLLHHKIHRTLSDNVLPNNHHPNRSYLHHPSSNLINCHPYAMSYPNHHQLNTALSPHHHLDPTNSSSSSHLHPTMKRKFSEPINPTLHPQYPFLPLPHYATPLPYALPESIEEYQPQFDPSSHHHHQTPSSFGLGIDPTLGFATTTNDPLSGPVVSNLTQQQQHQQQPPTQPSILNQSTNFIDQDQIQSNSNYYLPSHHHHHHPQQPQQQLDLTKVHQ